MNRMLIVLLLLLCFSCNSIAETVSCGYPEVDEKGIKQGINDSELCGELLKDNLLLLKKEIINKISWEEDGLACIAVFGTKKRDGWYVVNKQLGKGRITAFWTDNDCAPFSSGLNVGVIDNKVIFYNKEMDAVKITDYIWASGFDKGYSKVCFGDLKGRYDKYHDHYEYEGGLCGYIDTSFNVVIPLNYYFEKTPKP